MSKIYSSKIPIHNVRNNRNCQSGQYHEVITEERALPAEESYPYLI